MRRQADDLLQHVNILLRAAELQGSLRSLSLPGYCAFMLAKAVALLIEIDDEWQIGRHFFNLASMKELLEPDDETKLAALPIPLAPVH